MTDLLKRAFEAAAQLPEEEQKALAVAILAEVASDDGALPESITMRSPTMTA